MTIPKASLVAGAKRSVLLACAPASLHRLLGLLEKHCGQLDKAFYWSDKDHGGGVLLAEMESVDRLKQGLSQLSCYPRLTFRFTKQDRPIAATLGLSTFRLCSDPSYWPTNLNNMRESSYTIPGVCMQKPVPTSKYLLNEMRNCQTVDEQASILWQSTRLTYADALARFVVSDCIQELLSVARPDTLVSPFGSVMDNLGSLTSDLDLVIELGSAVSPELAHLPPCESLRPKMFGRGSNTPVFNVMSSTHARLRPVFLSLLRHLLTRIDPLGFHSTKIFAGRVPILHVNKFKLIGVSLDISSVLKDVSSSSHFHDGLHMVELMRTVGTSVPEFPRCIAVLKFVTRRFGLTHDGPSPGFTNFKLTILFLHFLQVHRYVPSFDRLALLIDHLIDEPACVQGLHPIPSIDVIMRQFVRYISTLDPSQFTLCLRSGRAVSRNEANSCQNSGLKLRMGSNSTDTRVSVRPTNISPGIYVMCPNPFHPWQNILHGWTEVHWSKLIDVFEEWTELMSNSTTRPPGISSADWGLLLQPTRQSSSPEASETTTRPASFKTPINSLSTRSDPSMQAASPALSSPDGFELGFSV